MKVYVLMFMEHFSISNGTEFGVVSVHTSLKEAQKELQYINEIFEQDHKYSGTFRFQIEEKELSNKFILKHLDVYHFGDYL